MRKTIVLMFVVGLLMGLSASMAFAQSECKGRNPDWVQVGAPSQFPDGVVFVQGHNANLNTCRIQGKWHAPSGQRQVVATNCQPEAVSDRIEAARAYAATLNGPGGCTDRNCQVREF